jgi:hypothetical protein
MGELADQCLEDIRFPDQDAFFENKRDERGFLMWRPLRGDPIPVQKLEDDHLRNILRAVAAGTARANTEMLDALNDELARRGLTPKPQFSNADEAWAAGYSTRLWAYYQDLLAAGQEAYALAVVVALKQGVPLLETPEFQSFCAWMDIPEEALKFFRTARYLQLLSRGTQGGEVPPCSEPDIVNAALDKFIRMNRIKEAITKIRGER